MKFRVAFKYRNLKLSMYIHKNFVVNPQEKLKLVKFCVPDRMEECVKPIRHELRQFCRSFDLLLYTPETDEVGTLVQYEM